MNLLVRSSAGQFPSRHYNLLNYYETPEAIFGDNQSRAFEAQLQSTGQRYLTAAKERYELCGIARLLQPR